MTINQNTKIGRLISHHPDALEAIVSLSPKFTKLRNPLLRKVMAGRTSIAMASRMGGCTVDDFFNKLKPLGFEMEDAPAPQGQGVQSRPLPAFMKNIPPETIVELDVRSIIEAGKDPLQSIVKEVNGLHRGAMLKIINSFEPTPLIHLLGKQGLESYVEHPSDDVVNTYFFKKGESTMVAENKEQDDSGWDDILNRFKDKLQVIDVKALEMPLPMHTILDALKTLPQDKALFVYHKRIPVYLLPELEEQQFSYRIKEISASEVHLLIYKT